VGLVMRLLPEEGKTMSSRVPAGMAPGWMVKTASLPGPRVLRVTAWADERGVAGDGLVGVGALAS